MESNQASVYFKNKLIILFLSYAIMSSVVAYNIIARLGFTIPFADLLQIVGLALFFCNLLVVKEFFGKKDNNLFSFHNLLLLALAGIMLISYLPSVINIVFAYLLPLLGFLGTLWVIYQLFVQHSFKSLLLILPVFAIFALWVVGKLYSTETISPLFLEKIAFGIGHRDTIFHLSIAQMLKTYNISSNGLDGFPYIGYHFGSHWMFARLSFFTGLSVVKAYNLVYPILFIPLYFQTLLYTVIKIGYFLRKQLIDFNIVSKTGIVFWLLFLGIHISLLPLHYGSRVAIWHSYIESESFLIALTFMFIIFCSLIDYSHFTGSSSNRLGHKILLCCLIIASFFLKMSVGLLFIPALAYLQFRHNQFFRWKNLIFWFTGLALCAFAFYFITKGNSSDQKLVLFHFFRTYTDGSIWYYIIHIHFIVLLLFLILRTYEIEKNTPETSLAQLIKLKKTTLAEVLIAIGFMSLLPGLILSIGGGSAVYFSDVMRKTGVVFLLSMAPFIAQITAGSLTITRRFILVVFLVPFTLVILSNTKNHLQTALVKTVNVRYEILPPGQTLKASLKSIQNTMEKRSEYQFIKKLDSLNHLPIAEKRKLLINVPHSDSSYYNRIGWPSTFIIPALTGIPALNGLPFQKGMDTYPYYGIARYQKREVPFIGSDNLDKLKERAKKLGIEDKKIIQFKSTFKKQ